MPPCHPARSARAALLWGLGAFAALQLGLTAAIETCMQEFRDPYYAYRAARLARRVRGAGRPLTAVFLGSSRVQDGFMASRLERWLSARLGRPVVVFNFGIPGAGPITNRLGFERLLARGMRPDLLFVEVWPVSLAQVPAEPAEGGHLHADRLWLNELPLLGDYRFALSQRYREWWRAFLAPSYGHRIALLSRLWPGLLSPYVRLDWARRVDDSGWQEPLITTFSPEERQRRVEADRLVQGPVLGTLRLGEPSCRAQRDLLRRCRDEGIPTLLVWMPESAPYRSWYSPAARHRLRDFLDGLRRQYGTPLIDARTWVADDGFFDGQHLTRAGAEAFTDRFGREILLPALVGWTGR